MWLPGAGWPPLEPEPGSFLNLKGCCKEGREHLFSLATRGRTPLSESSQGDLAQVKLSILAVRAEWLWSRLPRAAVESPSLQVFKRKQGKHWTGMAEEQHSCIGTGGWTRQPTALSALGFCAVLVQCQLESLPSPGSLRRNWCLRWNEGTAAVTRGGRGCSALVSVCLNDCSGISCTDAFSCK